MSYISSWSNRMSLVIVLAVFFSSFTLAEFQSLDNERNLNFQPREFNEERSWNRLEQQQQQQPTYDNENYFVDPLRQKPSPNYIRNSIENEGDFANTDYVDNGDSKLLAAKRAWKVLLNDRSRGWGKREQQQGNWNNLRGLWGKRSSWSRLQGSWG